jgi:adenine deaminase
MNGAADKLKDRILASRREIPADLVLKKARVLNVFSGTILECDVAVHDGVIVGLGPDYRGKEEIPLNGKWVSPGLIDGHIHIESSMLLPSCLAEALLPCGTTAIISDPHEIANVLGMEGIGFMIRESEALPLDVFFMAPSCVPATHLETSGARLDASELAQLKDEPRVLGLAEMMNYPGLLAGDESVLEKLILFEDRIIDGHAPSVRGYDLQAYLAAGIQSDHETSDPAEGMEKLQSGMMVMIREGTSARNLDDLLPLITEGNSRRFCFVSDDLHPQDIRSRGHLNFVMKRAIHLGLDPVTAVQLATLNPAQYFGLRGRGAVAPGYRADLVVLDELETFRVKQVYKDGRLVVDEGRPVGLSRSKGPTFEDRPLNIPPLDPKRFRIMATGTTARIIRLLPGQILTGVAYRKIQSESGLVKSDPETDILKLAVAERHRGTGRIGLGLVQGFGLKRGAMASSVAHDSHNLISVGVEDRDLCRAVEEVKEMGGGMAVVSDETLLSKVPLPVGGLMSLEPLEGLTEQLEALNRAAASLGCRVPDPFMVLSFLSLPVIPELKLTDLGLVDVNRFSVVPLFVEDLSP